MLEFLTNIRDPALTTPSYPDLRGNFFGMRGRSHSLLIPVHALTLRALHWLLRSSRKPTIFAPFTCPCREFHVSLLSF